METTAVSTRMTEDEARAVQKFCPLKPGDFILVALTRGDQRYYGYGRVREVNGKGVVLTYEGATGKTQVVSAIPGVFIWALRADRLRAPGAFMDAITARGGKPFTSWDDAINFAEQYAKVAGDLMARPK